MKLSIIIPAYNEEHRITETLFDIHNTMSEQLFDYEILVVNDGSHDNTIGVVEGLKNQIPNLFLINNDANHGKGWVIKQGMLKAKIVAKQPWLRIFLGSIFKIIVRTLVPLGLTDSQCGFKLFTEKSAQIIFPKQTIFRWAFDVEILAIARKERLKIKEVPITWYNNNKSRLNFFGMVKTFFELIQIRFKQ